MRKINFKRAGVLDSELMVMCDIVVDLSCVVMY